MKLVVGFVYLVLVSVFFSSSCLLILLVSGASGKDISIASSEKSNENNDEYLTDINTTDFNSTDNSSSDLKEEFGRDVLLEEMSSSLDKVMLSTLRDNQPSNQLLPRPPDHLKLSASEPRLAPPSNQLSEGGGVIVGDILPDNVTSSRKPDPDRVQPESDPQVTLDPTSDQIALDPGGESTGGSDGQTPPPVGPVDTPGVAVTTKTQQNDTQQTEDIPSFSEWTKKQLQEAEKNKGENLTWGGQQNNNGGSNRKKNYASPDCGAKVVSSNPEAISPSAMLSNNRDEYLLNPCTAKIWVVVELCEPIQPQRIELANFELFSSSPRELSVYLSDYPSREWIEATSLTAKDERTVQSFALPHLPQFVKFIKLELHSHYGTEHFCPLSLFRVYGTSEYEVLDSVEVGPPPVTPVESTPSPEEVDEITEPELQTEPKNLFGSAKAAVLSLVRRVAQVVKSPHQVNNSCQDDKASNQQFTDHCITPSYLLVCDNCTDHFFYRVYNLVCCQQDMLRSLMRSCFVTNTLEKGSECSKIGLDWTKTVSTAASGAKSPDPTHQVSRNKPKTTPNNRSPESDYLSALLPAETIAALCNMMAVSRKKIVLNMTSLDPGVAPTSESTGELQQTSTPPLNNTLVQPTSSQVTNATEDVLSSTPLPQTSLIPSHDNVTVSGSETKAEESEVSLAVNATSTQSIASPTLTSTLQLTPSVALEQGLDAVTLDSIFSVLEDETEQIKATTTPQPKESVFVRLANRIKVLETNLSLSSEYLEALSLRYKKQVDELQKNLNLVMEERRSALERETALTAQVSALVQRVDAITQAMTDIIMERESWLSKLTSAGQHTLIICVEICLFVVVLSMCKWLSSSSSYRHRQGEGNNKRKQSERRKSLDDLRVSSVSKKRRPSEEALTSAGATHNELLLPLNGSGKRKTSRTEMRKKKKRKRENQEKQEEESRVSSAPVVSPADLHRVEFIENKTNGNGALHSVESAEDVARPDSAESFAPRSHSFIRTALWSRKQRTSLTARQESFSSQDTQLSSKSKKVGGGVFKKFVKKIF